MRSSETSFCKSLPDSSKASPTQARAAPAFLLAGSLLALTMSYLASLSTIAAGDRTFDLGFLFDVDTLRPWLIYRDAFLLEDYSVWGWRHGVAPFFFPDYALLWPLFALGVDFRVAMYVFPMLLALISIGGWMSVCNTLFGKSVHRHAAVVLLHAAPFALSAGGLNDFYQTQFLPASHHGTWVLLPWLLLFFVKTHSKARTHDISVAGNMVAYGSLLAAVSASNLVVIVWFVVPAYCALATTEMREEAKDRLTFGGWTRCIAISAAGILVGTAAWFLLPFTLNPVTTSLLSLNPEKMLFALKGIAATFLDVSARDLLSLAIWILFSGLTLWRLCAIFRKAKRKRAKEGWLMNLFGVPRERKHVFMAAFVPLAMLTPLAANIATGNYNMPAYKENVWIGLRYVAPLLYFPLFVGWFLLPWNGVKRMKLHISSAAVASAFAFSSVAVIASWPGLKKLDPFASPLQDCFSRHAKRLDWRGGIVTTPFIPLVANPNTDVNRIVHVHAVRQERPERDRLNLYWMATNRHWFSGDFQFVALNAFKGRMYGRPPMYEQDKGCPVNDFAPCLNPALGSYVLDESAVLSALGEPAEVIDCAGVGFFHYDPPIRLDFSRFPIPDGLYFTYDS